jgi:hypothetical protein
VSTILGGEPRLLYVVKYSNGAEECADLACSVKYVVHASRDVMERSPSASCVLSSVPSASTESPGSSWMLETSLFSSG